MAESRDTSVMKEENDILANIESLLSKPPSELGKWVLWATGTGWGLIVSGIAGSTYSILGTSTASLLVAVGVALTLLSVYGKIELSKLDRDWELKHDEWKVHYLIEKTRALQDQVRANEGQIQNITDKPTPSLKV